MSEHHNDNHHIYGSSTGSKRDGVDYVRYLMDGSGAENSVDYTMLRRELESMSTPQTDFSELQSPPPVLTGISSYRPHRQSTTNNNNVFATPKSPIQNADEDLSSSSFNSNKLEIDSLNQSLKREGFDVLPNRIFAGLSRTVLHAVSAKFYEILSGHHFLRQKSEELNAKKNDLNDQVLALVNDLEKTETTKISLENQLRLKEKEILEAKQRNTQLIQKITSFENSDYEASSMVSTKDAALKKIAEDFERLETKVKQSQDATESFLKGKLGRPLNDEDKRIIDLTRPLIAKNQELIKELEDINRKNPSSVAKKWSIAKSEAELAVNNNENIEYELPAKSSTNMAPKSSELYSKEMSLLRKENEKLHLDLASRPSAREWKMAQHRIKDLENEILSKEKLGSSQQFTRKLIRNDKFHHMLDRNAQEVVSVHSDESSEMIKMVCLKLKLSDPYALVSTIDMLIEVVKYIPAMERFIREVDALVWTNEKVVNEQGVPHRLTATLANLKRYFKSNKPEDFPTLEGVANMTDDPLTISMIDHFKDLFDVESMEGIYPKMNELYVYVQETKTGLRILSSLLGLDDHVSVVRVLEECANFIRNYNNGDDHHHNNNAVNGENGNDFENLFEASTTIQV